MDHVAIVAWQLVGCALIGDFITGLVHWFEDTYLTRSTPILSGLLKESVIIPNIQHHKHPTWMVTMGTFLSRNITVWIPSFAIVGLIYLGYSLAGYYMPWQLWSIAAFTCLGNECHGWAHGSTKIWPVRFLQDTAIVTTPAHHGGHHRAPYDKRFCTLTNVVNPILDGLRFWRGLEWVIARITGIYPKRMTFDRDYV